MHARTHARTHARWYGRGDRPTEIKSTSGGARGDQGPRICCCWQGEAGEPAGESHLSAHASSYPPSLSLVLQLSLPMSASLSPFLSAPTSLSLSLYLSVSLFLSLLLPLSKPGPALLVVVSRPTPRPWGIYALSPPLFFPLPLLPTFFLFFLPPRSFYPPSVHELVRKCRAPSRSILVFFTYLVVIL